MKWSARMKHWSHSLEKFKEILFIKEMNKYYPYTGCKENHFYSLPFGQAEASIS